MMKMLNRPESFSKKFSKLLSSKISKKDVMLLMADFATVSQIANYCQIPFCIISFITFELTNVTSQDYVSLCERHKY